MNTRTLDFALRVRADVADGAKAMHDLKDALDAGADAAKAEGQALDAAAAASDRKAAKTKKAAAATKEAAQAADASANAGTKESAAADKTAQATERETKARERNTRARKQQNQEAAKTPSTSGANGISDAQYKQAMRQLPMQMTDIVSGLATGQSPFMVLMQQGGQLKDSFGGVRAAAVAVTGAISPMLVGLGAGAAAFALIGKAAIEGYQEIQALERGLISTGNIAGTTAGQLVDMADRVGDATGEYSQAEQASQALAASGKLTGASLEAATSAAVNLATLTGDSIDSTTQKIIALAESPTATLLKLNEQYHFLTLEVFEHVRALEAQGDAEDAAGAAVEAFAKIHEQRVREAHERAGWLEQSWESLGKTIAGVWNSLKSIGRTDAEAELAAAQSALANMRDPANLRFFTPQQAQQQEARIKQLQAEVDALHKAATAEMERQQVQDRGVTAAAAINKGLDDGASKTEKLAKATAELKRQFLDLRKAAQASGKDDPLLAGVNFGVDGSVSGGAYAKRLKQIQDQYKGTDTDQWDRLHLSNLSKEQKLQEEINKIKEVGLAAGRTQVEIDSEIAAARARYEESLPKTPKGPKTEAQKDNEAALRELENLQKMSVLQDSLTDGRTKATEAARIDFEVTQGAYKLADSSIKQQLRDQASLADAATARADADRKMVAVREQILGLQGGGEDAALAKARRELELFQSDLVKLGKNDDAAVVSKLLGLQQAQTDLKNLKQSYDQVMGEISIEIQRIQIEQQAGFITEADAQQRIVDLYRSKLGVLKDLVPQMREAALALGGDAGKAALANVEAIEVKLREMETTTNAIEQAFGTTFQQSLNSTLDGLINGTITLDKAVQSFLGTLLKGWAEWSAQDLSQKVGNWAKGKFGDFLGGEAQGQGDTGAAAITTAGTTAAQAIVTAGNTVAGAIAGASTGGAAAGSSWGAFAPQPGWQGGSGESLATDAAAMQGAGDSVNAGATAIGQSAVQLATAAGGLSPGASAVIQAALQLWQAAQAMLVANVAGSTTGYASGGWTGPGGMYDVAGVVHRDEVVIRKKITRQPAMLPFLLDVNARGWAAVDDWRGYANGGLVGGSTPIYDSPAPRYGAGGMPKGGGSSSLNQRLRLVVVDDPNRIPAALKSEVGEESFLFHAGRNTETLKQLLGIN